MAEIFRARTQGPSDFSKEVAIKKILPSLAHNEDFITQFLDEARIAGCLSHPNIVQIFDVGQVEESYYIAMEYVHCRHLGQTVRRVLDTVKTFPFRESAALINEVSKALSYAHTAVDTNGDPLSVIHRDVSPQNILLSFHGAVKLTDFGIAKATNKLYQTTVGVIKGKFSYLAPEQLKGETSSPRSDLFSLGVVFWEILSGRRLFLGQSDLATIRLVQSCEIPPIREIRPDIPPDLEQILNTLLAPDPASRYQTAQDVSQDLDYYLSSTGPSGMGMIAQFMRQLFPEMSPGQSQDRVPVQSLQESTNPGYVRPESTRGSQEKPSNSEDVETILDETAVVDDENLLPEQVYLSEDTQDATIDANATLLDQKAFHFDELVNAAKQSEELPPTQSLEVYEKLTAPVEHLGNRRDPLPAPQPQKVGDNLPYTDSLTSEEPLEETIDLPSEKKPSKKKGTAVFLVILLLGSGGFSAWYLQGLWRPILESWFPKPSTIAKKENPPTLTVKFVQKDVIVYLNRSRVDGKGQERTLVLVAGKTCQVEFRKEGFIPQKRMLIPEEGDEIQLQVNLKQSSSTKARELPNKKNVPLQKQPNQDSQPPDTRK